MPTASTWRGVLVGMAVVAVAVWAAVVGTAIHTVPRRLLIDDGESANETMPRAA